MRIGVVGTGYVGLVVGACLAENGNTVLCVDNDEEKIDALLRGEIPIYEPGLSELIPRNVAEERLSFTTDLAAAVRASDILFIAVGTPQDRDGSADLKYVLEVAEAIGTAMDGFKVVVTKSTVPVGTAALVQQAIAGRTSHPFAVVSNPEFLKEGAAVDDFLKPAGLKPVCFLVSFDLSKIQDIIDKPAEPFALVEDSVEIFQLCLPVDFFIKTQRLDKHSNRRQWRFQFVCDGGDELRSHLGEA